MNAHFDAAVAAQNGFCMEVIRMPALYRVVSHCKVAGIAGIVAPATFEFDRDDI